MILEEVLQRFNKVRKSGRDYSAQCSSHEDRKNSLSIGEAADGKILVKCHAGCETEAILSAVGLKLTDLFISNSNGKPHDPVVDRYVYVDEHGQPLFRVCRTASKDFFQERFESGAYIPKLNGVRRVLYNLPEITKANAVFVVEGEKDVETLRRHGLVGTTNAGGADGWSDSYAESFKDKWVFVIPDNDKPGRKHAWEVARSVLRVAKEVRFVELLGVPEKGDVSDYLAKHSKEELRNLVRAAKPLTAKDVEEHEKSNGHSANDWPEPQKLPDELPPVPAMKSVMIPESFRPWLTDIAERMQCPLDFPVIGAIVAAGSLIGRQLAIRPKRQDDWTVVPNLWAGVVGRPGIMKTPALDEAKKPLQRLEMDALKDHENQKQAHEIKLMVLKAKKEETQKKIKEAIASGASTEGFEIPKEEDLISRRYMVNDSTVEKLGELLNQNPNGLLLFRDELTGWLRTLDREGHENDRAFYLESWNGSGSYTYDRIGRGTLNVEAACVSILGGIQPGPLNDYLESTLKGGAGADGLFQRFQLLVYPDDPGPWKNIDRWPDTKAKNAAFEIFKKLTGEGFAGFVSSLGVVSQDENGDSNIPFLRFSPQGQEVFDDWRSELENKIRAGDEHPAVEAHLSKYRSLVPSLALIFHIVSTVVEGRATPVSMAAARMAAAWCDYLEAHARRVYHGLIQGDVSIAHRLANKIIGKNLPNPFTVRDVYRKGWTGLSDAEVIESGAAILDEMGWIKTKRVATGNNGGRPTLEYQINPRICI